MSRVKITAEEFERAYAERSGTTVERLRELGRIVAPCDCGEEICEGWQSTTLERVLDGRHCMFCGVPLFGGATVHKPDCEIGKLIAEHFPSIVCPQCGLVSYNPNDVRERYCGACHAFHVDLQRAHESST